MELRFSDVTMTKGGREVLRGVSGVLRRGQVTAILGPNGAGKSSLLHVLAGLEPAQSGNVTIDGAPLAALRPQRRARRIGFLPQKGEVHWNLSVRNLVALGRMAHGAGEGDATAIEAAMSATDVAHLAGRPMLSLSGGESARVLLARVLAGEPEWLMADEPLASLDPAHQLAVLGRLAACAKGGAGVAVVVHDINHAARIADHVLLMKDGAILTDGAARDVLTPDLLQEAFAVAFRKLDGDYPVFVPE